jgi:hypothetical protein
MIEPLRRDRPDITTMTEHLQSDAARVAPCVREQAASRLPRRARIEQRQTACRGAVRCWRDPGPSLPA